MCVVATDCMGTQKLHKIPQTTCQLLVLLVLLALLYFSVVCARREVHPQKHTTGALPTRIGSLKLEMTAASGGLCPRCLQFAWARCCGRYGEECHRDIARSTPILVAFLCPRSRRPVVRSGGPGCDGHHQSRLSPSNHLCCLRGVLMIAVWGCSGLCA